MYDIATNDLELNNYVCSNENLINISKLLPKINNLKKNNKPMYIKISLHPCSGKSFFVKYFHNIFSYNKKNIFLYDFDNYSSNDIRRSRNIFKYTKTNKHCCLLGCYENINENDSIIDITVVINYSKLLYNHKKRLLTYTTGWINLDDIIKSRQKLIINSIDNNIPIFLSISEALIYLIKNYKNTTI